MQNLEKWDESIHTTTEQKQRQRAAKNLDSYNVNYENKTGEFFNGDENEKTTLEHCSCMDFQARKLPCAHMYALADCLNNPSKKLEAKTKQQIAEGNKFSNSEIFLAIAKVILAVGFFAGLTLGYEYPAINMSYNRATTSYNYALAFSVICSFAVFSGIFYAFSLVFKELNNINKKLDK